MRLCPVFLPCLVMLNLSCASASPTRPQSALMMDAVESYLGAPYQYGGASPGGIDCSGLVMRIYQHVGIDLPHSSQGLLELGQRVRMAELRIGDILFFRRPGAVDGGEPLHVGLFIGEGRFAHASESRGVVVESFHNSYWRDLFLQARRIVQ